jgi:hypothetical protein
VGNGAMQISTTQARFLYVGPADQAAAAIDNKEMREKFVRLRAAADDSRSLIIPRAQPTNILGLHQRRASAPPPPENAEMERAIAILTTKNVENERLHAHRRLKRYSEMLEVVNPKCLTTISDRTGGHPLAAWHAASTASVTWMPR